ncbi:hypothetical protein [Nocardioides iriomotensis]|uniref:Uncharacterized protein n=1 Tax=Nocardioides iriomotensis TaxID=715784 RepID=A0A4Q5JAP4_9ACTN|nr:hypothetical protein [Nocardioides iriomotensis]RYU15713.1 hypothetical protein ETU37_00950 [Nocardioides iriomotensis]
MPPITPHPLATWVSMQVSPQRHDRLRRRRRAARLLAARRAAAAVDKGTVVTALPKIPAQRTKTATVRPGTVTSSPATSD